MTLQKAEMTRDEFGDMAKREGYGEPTMVHFEPRSCSQTHQHDKVSFVYVLDGEFILNRTEGASSYHPGETCLLDKDIDHAEEAGAEGTTTLVARK